MKTSAFWLAAALFLCSSPAFAQTIHVAVGVAAGNLIVGGKTATGGTAPTTGGFTILPRGEVQIGTTSLTWVDLTFAVSPMVVDPSSLETVGFLGAHDLGLDFHPENRLWSLAVRGSIGPANMRFCNSAWCLREWVAMPGGEVAASFHPTKEEGGLDASLSVRVLHADPTAWTWAGLSDQDLSISHQMVLVTGVASWRW